MFCKDFTAKSNVPWPKGGLFFFLILLKWLLLAKEVYIIKQMSEDM